MKDQQKELINLYIPKFISMLNIHRRFSVAAAWDLANEIIPDVTVHNLNTALEELVNKNLISFSRVTELFYLGKAPEPGEKQQPMPAEHIETLLKTVTELKNEVIDLKRKKSDK